MPKKIMERFEQLGEEKQGVTGQVHDVTIYEPVGEMGTIALVEALKGTKYDFIRTIRFWQTGSGDEGIRVWSIYFEKLNRNVKSFEYLECGASQLGCEFLARILGPPINHPLQVLKLDHNLIGDVGIKKLAEGLALNKTLQVLSLTYCGIT